MALRYLGGGSFIDISAVFGASISSFHDSLWCVVDAINSILAMEFHLPLDDSSWRIRTAAGCQTRGDGPFDNILGALDAIVVRKEQPAATDVACLADHWCRKGYYALNTQAICDSSYQFTWMSCTSPGSVHDLAAFSSTLLSRRLMYASVQDSTVAELIADGYCMVADEAYGASEILAVPWPGGGWRGQVEGLLQLLSVILHDSHSASFWHARVAVGCLLAPSAGALWKMAQPEPCMLQAAQRLPTLGCQRGCPPGSVRPRWRGGSDPL